MEAALSMTHLSLVLSIALGMGMLFNYFKLPTLVGYMIAGIVIGPSVFHLGGDAHTMEMLAEMGIVILLFMLGLELDMTQFRASLRTALFIAVSQLAVSAMVIYLLSFVFNWALPLVIILSFITALSSTAVAVSLLKSLKLLDTAEGALAVGILIAQDILVVPMLVVVGSLDSGLNVGSFLELGITLLVIVTTLFAIFELVTHPKWVAFLETFFSAGIKQPAIAGMALCFGAAALSGSVGLSTAFGAFACGLLIGNLGTLGKVYRKSVTPIHDVLVMIFFVSVGLLLDLQFAVSHWMEILVLVFAASALKIIGTALLLRLSGSSWEVSLRMSSILGHIGEFAFVLGALALSNGMLNELQYQLILSTIAVSLVVSPLWTKLLIWEWSADKDDQPEQVVAA